MNRLHFLGRVSTKFFGPISAACFLFAQISLAADDAPAKPRTFQEKIAARPDPALSTLAERSAPDKKGPDASESFLDILKLRDRPNSKAAPVLEKILTDHLSSTRIHGFAAAQALFLIGTPEAHQFLARHLEAQGAQTNWAIKYTSHWGMQEPGRSEFIEKFLLKNLSKSLVIELEPVTLPSLRKDESPAMNHLNIAIVVRNASDEAFHLDFADYSGDLLYLRDAEGRFVPEVYGGTTCPRDPDYIELKPGQTHRINCTIDVAETKGGVRYQDPNARLTASINGTGQYFELKSPGRFRLTAMYEANPLYEEQRKWMKVDETWKWWSGRAVSKPISIDIDIPVLPDTPLLKK